MASCCMSSAPPPHHKVSIATPLFPHCPLSSADLSVHDLRIGGWSGMLLASLPCGAPCTSHMSEACSSTSTWNSTDKTQGSRGWRSLFTRPLPIITGCVTRRRAERRARRGERPDISAFFTTALRSDIAPEHWHQGVRVSAAQGARRAVPQARTEVTWGLAGCGHRAARPDPQAALNHKLEYGGRQPQPRRRIWRTEEGRRT